MTGINYDITRKAYDARWPIKWIVSIGLLALVILIAFVIKTSSSSEAPEPFGSGVSFESEPTFDDLLDAIEWVESRGDANAVGDNGRAVGAYQIHKIYVDDCNRILTIWKGKLGKIFENYHKQHPDPNNIKSVHFESYTYEDRWNKKHSRFMTEVYLTYYAPLDDDYNINLEKAARIHNGGPQGWRKESTEEYWQKVKARMEAVK